MWAKKQYFFIGKYLMIDLIFLHKIYKHLNLAKSTTNKPFGADYMMFMGDFYQLLSVCGKPMYLNRENLVGDYRYGRHL